ncbi:uncharacterized protein EV154DRAFT_322989, partial [Mucor mucedo]|uniref:uncharacterized protein n=1 Tax=Mucor mucedo TaxID=29922 RepID=UPI00221F9114
GGGGHHVVVPNRNKQDHVDPIVIPTPPSNQNMSAAHPHQSPVVDSSDDKPEVVNQQADASRRAGHTKTQDEEEKWFEAMEASNMDEVVDSNTEVKQDTIKQYDPLSSSYRPDEEKGATGSNDFQHILDGYESISSGDNIIDEHISEASSQGLESTHSSPKSKPARRETTEDSISHTQAAPVAAQVEEKPVAQVASSSKEKLVTPGSPHAIKMQSSVDFLKQKQAKKRVTPTKIMPTKATPVAVPICVPTNYPSQPKEKFKLPKESSFTYRSKPLLPAKFHGNSASMGTPKKFLAKPTTNYKDTTSNEWGHSMVSEGGIVGPEDPQVIANIPRKLQTRPRFKPVTPARYKRQRLLNLVLVPARPY